MKNIHLIPTGKPSRLCIREFDNKLCLHTDEVTYHGINQNIYITNSEEIKEGDWYLTFTNNKVIGQPRKCEDTNWDFSYCKKIILTTDQDLIKEGVQGIDDEFLEWFVKNPSCEQVEVKIEYKDGYGNWSVYDKEFWYKHGNKPKFGTRFKIIIPKKEPKQETFGESIDKSINIISMANSMFGHKQETLEEAAENYGKDIGNKDGTAQFDFIRGAKWQEERMYSKDELIILLNKFGSSVYGNYTRNQTMEDFTIEWFEQNKKK